MVSNDAALLKMLLEKILEPGMTAEIASTMFHQLSCVLLACSAAC